MTEPQQKAERRATVDDQLARAARIDMAYKGVPGNTADFYALQVLSAALQSGQSSRLFQKLVKEKEMVTESAVSWMRNAASAASTRTPRFVPA